MQKPLVPVAKPVLAPAPASIGLSPGAPAQLPTGEEWLEQALGKMGLLHPGAWIAPSLVMMFGPGVMMALGMVIFPVALIMALMRLGQPKPEPRYPATFAVPAVVMLLLVLLAAGVLAGSTMGAGAREEGVEVELPTAPLPPSEDVAGAPAAAGWEVRLSEPKAGSARLLRVSNVPDVQRGIAGAYAGVPEGGEKVVSLRVWVRRDGSVDPALVQTEGATDERLEQAVVAAAPGMRFVYLDMNWMPAAGWVELGVLYAPPSSR